MTTMQGLVAVCTVHRKASEEVIANRQEDSLLHFQLICQTAAILLHGVIVEHCVSQGSNFGEDA